jgi:cytochrome c oxidase subunit 2
MPPTFPALTGGQITTGPIANHLDIVLNGSKKNPMMVAWGPQLSDMEIAAVITYERNALGNSVGDSLQPGEVAAARK